MSRYDIALGRPPKPPALSVIEEIQRDEDKQLKEALIGENLQSSYRSSDLGWTVTQQMGISVANPTAMARISLQREMPTAPADATFRTVLNYVEEDVRRTEVIYRALGIPEEYIPRDRT